MSSTTQVPQSAPTTVSGRIKKRVIVCCDGTWQDGVAVNARWKYTNVLRISRALNHEDNRFDPPIPQIVFYQSGIGSENNIYSQYVQGATGASLGEKVQEGYGFLAQNYQPGDEIFLFGFSRGAYTARMIAAFVGAIGVLDRQDMDHFAEIFVNYQKRGKTRDKAIIADLDAKLSPWTAPGSPGKKRADSDDHSFSVKAVCVFDTVGSLGLPEELTLGQHKMNFIFGFPDKTLGEHVENAFHALALNETRADFDCAKFEQTPGGRQKGQVLRQCWFTGSHSDIGGGWQDHDLADLTLTWMTANVSNLLSLDYKYMLGLPEPCYPWGEQPPHDPRTGIFTFTNKITRQLPTSTDDVTHETIHASVLKETHMLPLLQTNLAKNPALVAPLMPMEERMKDGWPYVPGKFPPHDSKPKPPAQTQPTLNQPTEIQSTQAQPTEAPQTQSTQSHPDDGVHKSMFRMAIDKGSEVLHDLAHSDVTKNVSEGLTYEKSMLGRHIEESAFGSYLKEWTGK